MVLQSPVPLNELHGTRNSGSFRLVYNSKTLEPLMAVGWRVQGLGFRGLGFIQGLGFRGLGFIQGLGFRGLGFAQGLGIRGFGFRRV